jgi:hypothetical protein
MKRKKVLVQSGANTTIETKNQNVDSRKGFNVVLKS